MQDGADPAKVKAQFEQTIGELYDTRNRPIKGPDDLRSFVEHIAGEINAGVTKQLIRTADSAKHPYTKVADLPRAMDSFYRELYTRLITPGEDPVGLAAWVEYRINLTDHFFADGCGKISKAVSGWVLMRYGQDLPTYKGSIPKDRYLCDSDARAVGERSNEADAIATALTRLHTTFQRHLRRPTLAPRSFGWVPLLGRAAENYAPPREIVRWAQANFGNASTPLFEQARTPQGRVILQNGPGGAGTTRRILLAAIALRELSAPVRSVLCMKKGRWKEKNGPGVTERTTQIVWAQLDAFQAAALFYGLGETFSANFYSLARLLNYETGELVEFHKQIVERL